MIVEKIVRKLRASLPEFQPSNPLAAEFKEEIREAQVYLSVLKEYAGCEGKFTWNKLKAVYASAEELLETTISRFLKSVNTSTNDEPMAQLAWKDNVCQNLRDFQLAKVLYNFTVEKLRLRKTSKR